MNFVEPQISKPFFSSTKTLPVGLWAMSASSLLIVLLNYTNLPLQAYEVMYGVMDDVLSNSVHDFVRSSVHNIVCLDITPSITSYAWTEPCEAKAEGG